MTSNPVRKALLERRVTLGTWIQLGHPGIAEVFANAGFDWIAADCEHTDIDVEGFSGLARGMCRRGAVPLVRVRENDTLAIRRVLDAGAEGVIVPLVNTAGEARKAVLAAKYPPQGIRGFAFCRANNWGIDFDRYANDANDNIAVVAMVESRQAVENIDDILAVDGIDGVFIGPYDLSGSYGITGQTSHTDILNACKTIADACEKHGKSAGVHIVKPAEEAVKRAISDGFTFIALGIDVVFLDSASRQALRTVREIIK